MANSGISPKVLKYTFAVLKRCGWNQVHTAQELGISNGAVCNRIRVLKLKGYQVPSLNGVITRPKSAGLITKLQDELKQANAKIEIFQDGVDRAKKLHKPPVLTPKKRKGDPEDRVIVVFPDVHGVYADKAAVNAFLGDLKSLKPWGVVGLGDLIDCGGFLAQHHTMGFVAETAYSYEEDIQHGGVFLDSVQEQSGCENVHLIEGNHDMRPEKWAVTSSLRNRVDAEFLRSRVAPQDLLNYKGRGFKYYRRAETYDGMPVQGAFRIGKLGFFHGLLQGNNDPSRVLQRFGHSMIYGHTHQIKSTIKPTMSGAIGAWNIGTLAQLRPLYAHGSPTEWCHGYGIAIMSKSGRFQFMTISINDGVSLLPKMTFR